MFDPNGGILANTLEYLVGDIEAARRRAEVTLRQTREGSDAALVAEALHGLASTLANLGEFERAIYHYERVLELSPGHPSATHNLGIARSGQRSR